ncbi:hypothetical protein RUND412_008271 [Rhizina undulata]
MTVISKLFTAFLAVGSLSSIVLAHGEPNTVEAISARNVHVVKARSSLEKCSEKLKARDRVSARLAKRNAMLDRHIKMKRSEGMEITPNPLHKRQTDASDLFGTVECVLAPEVTVGPYYVANELIRDDIREGQDGIELLVDLQLVDVNTCEVVPDAYVDFWHCNTTGVYSGYAVEGTDGLTFNRGLQASDSDGIVQITTNFPGWYSGRATHIHIAAHLNGTVSNSYYSGGTVSHIGQLFFPESILSEIDGAATYSTNSITRLANSADSIYVQEDTGYDALTDITWIGSSLTDGLIASISVGIDTTVDYTTALNSGGSDGGSGGGSGGPGGPGQ